jgi:ParB family chromosome partitioning protein
LIDECELTQEELSQRVGKNRTTISNYMRLLKLPVAIQVSIRDGKISMGHARALINIEDEEIQLIILGEIIEKDLSVREVEVRARDLNKPAPVKKTPVKAELPSEVVNYSQTISERYNTKVSVQLNNKGKGSIVISFQNKKELERLLQELVAREQ